MERKLLVSDLTIGYEGLFDSQDFFRLIDDWFKQNGYEKNEVKHIERVHEKGKFIDLQLIPYKDLNDYTRFEIDIKVRVRDLVDTKIKRSGQEFKVNKGKISISIDAFLATDVKHRWESEPFSFFMRTIFNKFLYREYTQDFEQKFMRDVKNLHSELKSYLNLQRFAEQA